MRDTPNIPVLRTHIDWLDKASFELARFAETSSVYDMMNCFLDVNAVPEWIEKDGKLSQTLRDQATAKLEIMRQHPIDLAKLGEIDNQLRFVRLFCNYAKHLDPKPSAGIQNITMCSALPAEYPIRFDRLAVDGEIIYPSKLLGSVIEFWVQAEARYLQSSTSK